MRRMRSWSTTYRESALSYIQHSKSGQHLLTTRVRHFFAAPAGTSPHVRYRARRLAQQTRARARAAECRPRALTIAVPYSAASSAGCDADARGPRPAPGPASAFSASTFACSLAMSSSRLPAILRRLAQHAAGAGRDETADDDVLLQALERVDLAVDGGVGEHARGLLERGRGDERAGLQRRLGDAEQHRLARRRPLARPCRSRRLTSSTSTRSSCSPLIRSVSPGPSISTFCSIWRTITSMCLSLMVTPCSR